METNVNKIKEALQLMKESTENLDELSKKTLGSYVKKAGDEMYFRGNDVQYHSNKSNNIDRSSYFAKDSIKKHDALAAKSHKKASNRSDGISRAVDRLTKEEVEKLDELSKKTLGSYIKRAKTDLANRESEITYNRFVDPRGVSDIAKHNNKLLMKRAKRGDYVDKAVDKLTKEDVEKLDELSKKTLASYIGAASYDKSTASHDIGRINQKAATTGTTSRDRAERDELNNRHGKRSGGIQRAANKLAKEEVEVYNFGTDGVMDRYVAKLDESQKLDELSKKTLGSYVKKAADRVGSDAWSGGRDHDGTRGFHKTLKAVKRTKNIAKAIDKITKEEVETLDELSKNTLKSYHMKAQIARNPLHLQQRKNAEARINALKKGKDPSKVKTPPLTPDQQRIKKNRDIGTSRALKRITNESYSDVYERWVTAASDVAEEIYDLVNKLVADHDEACDAAERIQQSYKNGTPVSPEDSKTCNAKFYDAKYIVRQLEDVRDALLAKTDMASEVSEKISMPVVASNVKPRYESVNPEKRIPVSIHDALAMMENRELQAANATSPETIDDKLSGMDKVFIAMHKVQEPDESNVNAAINKNKIEVDASLQRRVNYRPNDQINGDTI